MGRLGMQIQTLSVAYTKPAFVILAIAAAMCCGHSTAQESEDLREITNVRSTGDEQFPIAVDVFSNLTSQTHFLLFDGKKMTYIYPTNVQGKRTESYYLLPVSGKFTVLSSSGHVKTFNSLTDVVHHNAEREFDLTIESAKDEIYESVPDEDVFHSCISFDNRIVLVGSNITTNEKQILGTVSLKSAL